jgi:translation initiation factor IF-3
MRNEQIIFDSVKVINGLGESVGVMNTPEALVLARSKGLDLVLMDFHSDPPVCRIMDHKHVQEADTPIDESHGFSFDPTKRIMKIQISSSIAPEELEMKIDILRKHLLSKSRCELEIVNKQGRPHATAIQQLITRIVSEVCDVGKLASSIEFNDTQTEFTANVWPCNPDQTEPPPESEGITTDGMIEGGSVGSERRIRRRVDPKIQKLIRHPEDSNQFKE